MRATLLIGKDVLSKYVIRLQKKKSIMERRMELALKKVTFLNEELSEDEKLFRILRFNRYTIVRHPLERLLSAYIDKIKGPVLKVIHPVNYFERLKQEIFKKYCHNEFEVWKQSNRSESYISFTTFLKWITNENITTINEHFMPQYYNCEPCRMDYHFYGNFKNFSKDAAQILEQFSPSLELLQTSYHPPGKTTSDIMTDYYSQVSKQLKQSLYFKFSIEFDFYHSLYPSEKAWTYKLLEITP